MSGGGLACDARPNACGPLDLIHTNKSPNPVSMRVPGRLTLTNVTLSEVQQWVDFLSGPVGRLYLDRRAADAKSTG